MIRIVTSSFSTKLPAEFTRLSIARWAPRPDRTLPMVRELRPGAWFKSVDVETYARLYREQLAQLDARAIVAKIEDLAAGRPAALLCWERPRDDVFCHRGFVSAWLHDELGLQIYEHGLIDEGCGHAHPKLPPEFRLAKQPLLV